MYHHHHQGKNIQASSRMPIHPERHLFLQGVNDNADSGLVLSTDAKPRLKWTPDLHERFIEAVNQLGGAESKHTRAFYTSINNSKTCYNLIQANPYSSFNCRSYS